MENQATVTALAAYAQGRHDGFKAGMIIGFGALVFVKTMHKHVHITWNTRNNKK